MIIKIFRGQPELKVTLVKPGREGKRPESAEGIRLVISAPKTSRRVDLSKIVRHGDWGYPPLEPPDCDVYPEDPTDYPALVYPAAGLDEEGAVVFRLDGFMWRRPCGRYHGRVEMDGGFAAEMEIDLHPVGWVLDGVEVGP